MTIVVDASAALGFIGPTQHTHAAIAFFAPAPHPMTAPMIFAYELRNAALRIERRHSLDPKIMSRRLTDFMVLMSPLAQPLSEGEMPRLIDLARAEAMSFFDACYLDLAMRLGAELATRDAALVRAAARRKVIVHDLR